MENEAISSVGAISRAGGVDGVGLRNTTALAEEYRVNSFSNLIGDAVEKAVNRPSFETPVVSETEELMAHTTGVVGDEKMSMVSDVARPGATEKPVATEDVQQQTEDRMRELYVDLTNYQIAWKIAQRIQQDTSQLLRGS